jgi:hypothetical protein
MLERRVAVLEEVRVQNFLRKADGFSPNMGI